MDLLHKTLFCLVTVIFICEPASGAYPREISDSLISLDVLLSKKNHFDNIKEHAISTLREKLSLAKTLKDRYRYSIDLYDQYKTYQYDSAFVYATKSFDLATQLGNIDYQAESKCALIFCLMSAGLYKEAFDELETIDISKISPPYRKIFFALSIRLHYAISDYNHSSSYYDKYVSAGNSYTDSIIAYLPPKSDESSFYTALRLMKNRDYDKSIALFDRLLLSDSISTHDKAIIHSSVGWMHWLNGDTDAGIKNLIESAKCDMRASVKETTALCGLGEILYNSGDIERANEYVLQSLKDANFYGARQRKIEVNNILPIIEQDRYSLLQRQRNIVLTASIIILALVVALSAALFVVSRQKKKLEEAHCQIEEHNAKLTQINTQLREISKIKNEYIGNSFYQSACFIDKIEKAYKTVANKIAARQYSDASSYLKESMIKEERTNVSSTFDTTFLKIFPGFIEQYNSLFPEEERKYPERSDTLTTEMRIFALIRLGVSDSERIAQFLRKSIHTINTYKTRVKNKSSIENEHFESRIMEIGRGDS